jgi:hypothetical protein
MSSQQQCRRSVGSSHEAKYVLCLIFYAVDKNVTLFPICAQTIYTSPPIIILYFVHISSISSSYFSFKIIHIAIFGNMRTDHVYITYPSSFHNLFVIFSIFYIYFTSRIGNITIFGNVRTDHAYIILPILIPHFFLIFSIFYSDFWAKIANITIFGIVCTDHVYITPPSWSHIFSWFFFLIYRYIWLENMSKTARCSIVGNHQFSWEKGKVQR